MGVVVKDTVFSLLLFSNLHGRQFLCNNFCLLFLGYHDLEAIKVCERGSLLLRGEFLGPTGGFPLGVHVRRLPGFVDGLLARIELNVNGKVCKRDSAKGDDLSGNASGRAVNEALVLVDNVNDDGEFAFLGSVVDQDHAADFHVSLERHDVL